MKKSRVLSLGGTAEGFRQDYVDVLAQNPPGREYLTGERGTGEYHLRKHRSRTFGTRSCLRSGASIIPNREAPPATTPPPSSTLQHGVANPCLGALCRCVWQVLTQLLVTSGTLKATGRSPLTPLYTSVPARYPPSFGTLFMLPRRPNSQNVFSLRHFHSRRRRNPTNLTYGTSLLVVLPAPRSGHLLRSVRVPTSNRCDILTYGTSPTSIPPCHQHPHPIGAPARTGSPSFSCYPICGGSYETAYEGAMEQAARSEGGFFCEDGLFRDEMIWGGGGRRICSARRSSSLLEIREGRMRRAGGEGGGIRAGVHGTWGGEEVKVWERGSESSAVKIKWYL
ncbi:hypothetical protein FB45DRAFT_881718 [Roridomyces roridus]|uniref:Uncharacterized protein n=1 Tax=Roridomyces roridus TaxID=1738132 RepID=A0AAD7AXT8_9AGAR|nr:hypothetical protein FB45DRAFT_881718 [Roridomyces roridus]